MNKLAFILLIGSFFLNSEYSNAMSDTAMNSEKLKPCPNSPNCVNSQSSDEKHFIEPIRIQATASEAKDLILKVLETIEANNTVVVVEEDYIRAEFVSKMFRFVDDVEFYFPESDGEELTIHVRSASRMGYSDLGVNRKRIELLRTEIEKLNDE